MGNILKMIARLGISEHIEFTGMLDEKGYVRQIP